MFGAGHFAAVNLRPSRATRALSNRLVHRLTTDVTAYVFRGFD